ncbi:hypothetical protein MY9_1078 [Bacillus sp. JS]|nr:hypothetical protein MY9_1078 [Bacillus sp. JS]
MRRLFCRIDFSGLFLYTKESFESDKLGDEVANKNRRHT